MALVATTWGLAVAAHWIGSTTAAVAAFAAVALIPGALLDRQWTGDRLTRAAELPARALTLSIGIVASLFTALVVSRFIFDYALATRRMQTLSI